MDRIVLEVNNTVAKAWRDAPSQLKQELEKDIELLVAEKIREAEMEILNSHARTTSAEDGLTQSC